MKYKNKEKWNAISHLKVFECILCRRDRDEWRTHTLLVTNIVYVLCGLRIEQRRQAWRLSFVNHVTDALVSTYW